MSLESKSKTIGELSSYSEGVGGLLRLKRREEKYVTLEETQKQINKLELTQQNYDALKEVFEIQAKLYVEAKKHNKLVTDLLLDQNKQISDILEIMKEEWCAFNYTEQCKRIINILNLKEK